MRNKRKNVSDFRTLDKHQKKYSYSICILISIVELTILGLFMYLLMAKSYRQPQITTICAPKDNNTVVAKRIPYDIDVIQRSLTMLSTQTYFYNSMLQKVRFDQQAISPSRNYLLDNTGVSKKIRETLSYYYNTTNLLSNTVLPNYCKSFTDKELILYDCTPPPTCNFYYTSSANPPWNEIVWMASYARQLHANLTMQTTSSYVKQIMNQIGLIHDGIYATWYLVIKSTLDVDYLNLGLNGDSAICMAYSDMLYRADCLALNYLDIDCYSIPMN